MALIQGITFAKATSLVQILTRDNGNITQYATPAVCLDAFNQAVKDVNQRTRSRIVSNIENPVIYLGPSVQTYLSAPASSGASSIQVNQFLTIQAGQTLYITDPTPANSETVIVSNSYAGNSSTIPLQSPLAHNHIQGCSVASNTRLYDFPTGLNSVYSMEFNGIELVYGQLDTLYKIYSIFGQSWYNIKGYPKYWYMDQNKFGIFPIFATAGLPIVMWSTQDPTQPSGTGDTTTTTGIDAKLDMAVVYWMCDYISMSRREVPYAQAFQQKWKDIIDGYMNNQNQRMSREHVEFLDHTGPYLNEPM